MKVLNVHATRIGASAGPLLDSLASDRDLIWPRGEWPAIGFDRSLGVGASGGHGPIGYFVEEYEPGRRIRFRFTRPRGFDGYHELLIDGAELRHELIMETRGVLATLSWLIAFRPLHDALIEDALANARRETGGAEARRPWSVWVVLLRRLVKRKRNRRTKEEG